MAYKTRGGGGPKKPPKGFSKKAVKAVNKSRKTPVTKRHNKTVMKDDPSKPGRKVGYVSVSKTKLPKYHGPKTKKR